MIGFLVGKLVKKTPSVLYLNVSGVGYEIQISLNTYSRLPKEEEEAWLYTQLIVKEDSLTLYGFYSIDEKELFNSLISVSGIGANTARIMLSSMEPNELKSAIMMGDDRKLTSIKGIGAKTAQRVVLELKEKMMKLGGTKFDLNKSDDENRQMSIWNEACDALVALGISRLVAEKAVKKTIDSNSEIIEKVEELIKKALQNI